MMTPQSSYIPRISMFSQDVKKKPSPSIKWLYGCYTRSQRYTGVSDKKSIKEKASIIAVLTCGFIFRNQWFFLFVTSGFVKKDSVLPNCPESDCPKCHKGVLLKIEFYPLRPAARCDILRIERGTTAHKVVDLTK